MLYCWELGIDSNSFLKSPPAQYVLLQVFQPKESQHALLMMYILGAFETQLLQGREDSSTSAYNHRKMRSNFLHKGTGAAFPIPMENNMALKTNIDNNCC